MPVLETSPPLHTLVDCLLKDQQRLLTPAAEFAGIHTSLKSRSWQRLIPLTAPAPGEQYGFEVNLDACTGCKACVSACHSLNGLDEDESWRDTGQLSGPPGEPWVQTVTTACHHCADPGCLNGCPVLAYEKDPATGIVRHLDDQCMGCSYCVLKCPYDVPKYSNRLGIVRKCDMCQGRLAEGEAPACVQACPNGAISIRSVPVAAVRDASRGSFLLPGTAPSHLTMPASRYVSARKVPQRAVSSAALRRDKAHPPLSVMLVLTQMSAGAFCFLFGDIAASGVLADHVPLAVLSCLVLFAGLAASVLHLGRPLKAWRAFLGWRKSWLSREIILFNTMAACTTAVIASVLFDPLRFLFPSAVAASALSGLLSVYASVMVYADTGRPFWRFSVTAVRFFGTAILSGALLMALCVALYSRDVPAGVIASAGGTGAVLFALDAAIMHRAARDAGHPCHPSAMIMRRLELGLCLARFALLGFALLLIAALLAQKEPSIVVMAAALCSAVAAQLIERHQFFTAAAGPSMPR